MQKNTRFIIISLLVLAIAYFFLSSSEVDDSQLAVDVDAEQLDSTDEGDDVAAENTTTVEGDSVTMADNTTTGSVNPTADYNAVSPAPVNNSALTAQPWVWQETKKGTGEVITPASAGAFVLTLSPDGTFSAQTDCNAVSGNYQMADNILTFGQMASTKMACEGSQEKDFTDLLAQTQRYAITPAGNLELTLMLGFGTGVFAPQG